MNSREKELTKFFLLWSTQSLSQLGSAKGSGAALMMFILGITGTLLCLTTGRRLKRYKYGDPS